MKKLIVSTLAVLLLSVAAPKAQEMPAPHKAPHVAVNRQVLPEHTASVLQSRNVQGQATIIDGEKLRIGDVDLRLFGIVPPQLSANYGPQARSELDNLTSGQTVECTVRDRDHDGRYLATCRTARTPDLALELLRRGLAVTARGSLAATDLVISYLAAEQAAQTQKLGLWSSAPAPAPVVTAAPVPETAKADLVKTEAPKTENIALPTPPLPTSVDVKKDDRAVKPDKSATPPLPLAAPTFAAAAPADMASVDEAPAASSETPGFLARYQVLIAGLIILVTAFGILGVISIQRRIEKREEMKAIAAALRGELMAARAVCLNRLKTITTEAEDRTSAWPRIRATLYQAYVGRLGWLGAELARQVASIYGQASDYGAYYNVAAPSSDEARDAAMPKRQALQILAQHIESVLPRLAAIEQKGRLPQLSAPQQPALRTSTPVQQITSHTSQEAPAPDSLLTYERTEPAVSSPPETAPSETNAFSPKPIWSAMRKFAHDRMTDKKTYPDTEDLLPDYTSLIEEEMASLSFSEGEDSHGSDISMDPVTHNRTGS